MPEFTLDVYGKEYVIDAPDEKSAVDAALGDYKANFGEPQASASAQMPVESGTLLTTPLEGGGQPAQQPAPPSEAAQIAGGALRGGATIGAGALAGAAMGAPLAGVGAIPGAIAGASAAALTGPILEGINQTFGTNYRQ